MNPDSVSIWNSLLWNPRISSNNNDRLDDRRRRRQILASIIEIEQEVTATDTQLREQGVLGSSEGISLVKRDGYGRREANPIGAQGMGNGGEEGG